MINRRNGRPTDLRVNLTRLPTEFHNIIRTVDFYKNQFDSIAGKVRYATGRNNRDDDQRSSSDEPVKEKSTFDTVMDTAHMVADVLNGLDD